MKLMCGLDEAARFSGFKRGLFCDMYLKHRSGESFESF